MGSQRLRAYYVTLLDAGFIIAASGALVLMLGGGGHIDLAGLRITIRGVANPLTFAAAFGALRVLIDRRSRFLPAILLPHSTAIETERRRFAAPAPATMKSRERRAENEA